MNDRPPEFPFPSPGEDTGYDVFPANLENDPCVVFHGTAGSNLESILENGFRIRGELPSVSFAKRSAVPLGYAYNKRDPKGVVIAARFPSLASRGVKEEVSCVYLYDESNQPTIVGYVLVPEDYVHS